jgi:predicted MFS family arabinose efflux permease
MRPRSRIAVFLLAAGVSGWNCGNVGPIVGPLASEFDATLAQVGLISGTFFFAGCVVANLFASHFAPRIDVLAGIRAACLLSAVGNVILAASPDFAGLIAGRVVAGLGVGLSILFVPAYARAVGGVRLLGVFGAGLTLGIATSLALGSVMEGEGVDWRVAFAITAVLGIAPLAVLPAADVEIPRAPHHTGEGLLRRALASGAWWRVEMLGVTVLTVPLVVGAWLVHYLTAGEGISASAAGALSFLLFGVSAVMRDVAGRLAGRGTPVALLVLGGLSLAAAGLLLLGEDRSLGPATAAIVLLGVGLSLPYPLFYDWGERLFPDRPLAGLASLQVFANAFPILAVPLFGAALAGGDEGIAFGALAVVTVISALLNMRPAVGPAPAGPADSQSRP